MPSFLNSSRVVVFAVLCGAAFALSGCESPPKDLASVKMPVTSPTPPGGIVEHPDTPFRVLSRARPNYPSELRRRGITGQAMVRFVVGTDGKPHDIAVVRATHPEFAAPAAIAVSKWTFEPATKDGQTANTVGQIPIVFSLSAR